jgi:uncharacterized protein YgbK (DUF1537 family)
MQENKKEEMLAEVQKLTTKKIMDKREELKLDQLKAVIKELNSKITKQQETIKKSDERIDKLKYNKDYGSQVDSML